MTSVMTYGLAKQWLDRFEMPDPYQGFDYLEVAPDMQGWGCVSPVFHDLLQEQYSITNRLGSQRKPILVVEVGTWKGASAIWMGKWMKDNNVPGVIICVDTWLGSLELRDVPRRYGYPTLYENFLANVCYSGLRDYIVPMPMVSVQAARFLRRQMRANLIYIDASHEEEDVYADLREYHRCLAPGGVMFGDDWEKEPPWYGVICAVNRFQKEHALDLSVRGEKWILRRPTLLSP